MITRTLVLGVSLLTSFVIGSHASAQGPWPVLGRPTFTTPFQEFTPNRTNTYYQPIAPAQTNWTPANAYPAQPRGANGQCNSATGCNMNGQCGLDCCASGVCANGRCAVNSMNGQAPLRTRVNSGIAPWGNAPSGTCRNGQCRLNGQGTPANYGPLRQSWTPIFNAPQGQPGYYRTAPQQQQPSGVNRLIPLDGGYAAPTYHNRSSELETENRQAFDSDVRLQ